MAKYAYTNFANFIDTFLSLSPSYSFLSNYKPTDSSTRQLPIQAPLSSSSSSLVQVDTTSSSSYALLRPIVASSVLPVPKILTNETDIYSVDWEGMLVSNRLISLDIETRGTNAHDPNSVIVGISIYHPSTKTSVYLSIANWSESARTELFLILSSFQMLLYNAVFDMTYLVRDSRGVISFEKNLVCDVYVLYKSIANDGWRGQRWGLKKAQTDVLKWPASGDVKLDEWLVDNSYWTKTSKTRTAKCTVLRAGKWHAPEKSEMWRAPADTLGYYCALDSFSTYDLFDRVLMPSIKQMPVELGRNSLAYHHLVLVNIEQISRSQMTGFSVNKSMIQSYISDYLNPSINSAHLALGNIPELQAFLTLRKADLISRRKMPRREKKDGTISKVYLTYMKKVEEIQSEPDWTKLFNVASGKQLNEFFYVYLKKPVLFRTKKNNPSVGVKAMKTFGPVGEPFLRKRKLEKELGYVQKCLDSISPIDGRIHAKFNIFGSITGRHSGTGGFSVHQQPKSRKYLMSWGPTNPGSKWLSIDWTSIENVCLAEVSRDTSMLKLYGPGAPEFQDAYLFNGSQMAVLKEKILATGYNPHFPTRENIEAAKKYAKTDRQMAKSITLACNYGAGIRKIFQLLTIEQGLALTYDQVSQIWYSFWALYSGIKLYEKDLQNEWLRNGKYTVNALGRTIAVHPDFLKDLVSRNVQSLAHDFHMLYVCCLTLLTKKANLDFDWVVVDWHDQSIVEPKHPEDIERMKQIMGRDSLDLANSLIRGLIRITGDVDVCSALGEIKGT